MIFLATGLLVVSVILYAMTGEGDTIAGLPRDDFVRIAGPLSILIFVMAGVTRLSRGETAQAFKAFGSWVAIFLVFIILYLYSPELRDVRDRVVQEFQPGTAQTVARGNEGRGAVVRLRKGNDGHFVARPQVNGKVVRMIVDTGASTVVLRPEDARRAGIRVGDLSYSVPVDTANGRAYAARVRIERVSIGPVMLESVDALITRPGALQQSLLGMSFLSRLQSYEFSGNQLVMRS